jgi:hypothetical protein
MEPTNIRITFRLCYLPTSANTRKWFASSLSHVSRSRDCTSPCAHQSFPSPIVIPVANCESVNVLPRLADRPSYRCRFSAEIELKRGRERDWERARRLGGKCQTSLERWKGIFRKSLGPRECGCVRKCTLPCTRLITVKWQACGGEGKKR